MATSLIRSKGSQSSLQIATFSFWMKLCSQGNNLVMYSNTVENDNNRGYIQLTTDGKLRMVDGDSSGTHIQLRTNRVFRDFNAWTHFVVRVDTTQSTSTDRVRLYINGVQETSFDQTDYPAQNDNLKILEGGQTNREYINRVYGGSAYSDNFILSHFHFTDGYSYGPDTFGSTDSSTGEWKINVDTTVNYGNQGFFMFKDDASLNDDSGNGNNWSADSGTVQKTEDNPSNVFATLNPLINTNQTLSIGNTVVDFPAGGDGYMYSTLAFSSGKFYAEFKINSFTADRAHALVLYTDITSTGLYLSFCKTGNANTITSFGSTAQSGLASFSAGDIIGMAVDADNGTVDFTRNGSAYGSQVTGLSSNFSGKDLFFGFLGEGHASQVRVFNASTNFGNGYFGTTAVSSAGTNASGNGIFEYDVPTGYTALSTKGLNL